MPLGEKLPRNPYLTAQRNVVQFTNRTVSMFLRVKTLRQLRKWSRGWWHYLHMRSARGVAVGRGT
jgi:hypothetical protein